MEPLDIHAAIGGLQELAITPAMTDEQAATSMRFLAPFNQCMLGVVCFSGQTPWERHPDGDELLHVLAGGVEVEVLTDAGSVNRSVAEGQVFVVPRGLWHRQLSRTATTLLFATAVETSESSWSADPRRT